MLGQTRADVQVTSLLRDLSLSVLLYAGTEQYQKRKTTTNDRKQAATTTATATKTPIAAETETVEATSQQQPQ